MGFLEGRPPGRLPGLPSEDSTSSLDPGSVAAPPVAPTEPDPEAHRPDQGNCSAWGHPEGSGGSGDRLSSSLFPSFERPVRADTGGVEVDGATLVMSVGQGLIRWVPSPPQSPVTILWTSPRLHGLVREAQHSRVTTRGGPRPRV